MINLRGVEVLKDSERKEIVVMTVSLFMMILTSSKIILPTLTEDNFLLIARLYMTSAAFLVIDFAWLQLNVFNHENLLLKWLDVVLIVNLILTIITLLLFVWSSKFLVYAVIYNSLLGLFGGIYASGDFIFMIGSRLRQSSF